MHRRSMLLLLLGAGAASAADLARANAPRRFRDLGAAVRAVLNRPERQLDYLDAKLALDALIDPSAGGASVRTAIEALTTAARSLAGDSPDDARRLAAVRTVIYRSGDWNQNRPFAYDHADPFGRNIRNKLMATYLDTRLGNCVSMPILFLILADRLGVNVRLSTAPHHVFVRYVDAAGHATNLETTSGGLPSRDKWIRQNMPMTDEAVASGIYLRTQSRRETVATMATTVEEYLCHAQRDEEAIAVADAILQVAPRNVECILYRGSVYGRLFEREFSARYVDEAQIPQSLHARYQLLASMNQQAFTQAEALGWRPEPDQRQGAQ
ncbi:MAG: hypothetical protein JSS00_08300 [Proteobacteria bacterium]|nr:hypothetical protein [Pseudomonadota bacterium]